MYDYVLMTIITDSCLLLYSNDTEARAQFSQASSLINLNPPQQTAFYIIFLGADLFLSSYEQSRSTSRHNYKYLKLSSATRC